MDRLQVIKVAREVGFTIAEIALLLNGFPHGTPASKRWQTLAKKKLPEIDELMARARQLRALVQGGLNCTCGEIELCIGSRGHTCATEEHVCVEGVGCGCQAA